MKIIKLKKNNFIDQVHRTINNRSTNINKRINSIVTTIISDVKKHGDNAIFKYSKKFDKINLNKNTLILNKNSKNMSQNFDNKVLQSFKKSIKNITKFHKKQFPRNIVQNETDIILKSEWKAIDSVGLYVPGGEAFYPSSLIMNVIPAKIAGVKRIVCVTPPTDKINPYFLALQEELEIDETYFVGGAQAIAALALGTKSIKPVNKIFGPGNAYVAEAKKQLYGKVGIDLIAGPSEIIVVANNNNNPSWVAADLMAQAEHDINTQSILITDDINFAKKVLKEIEFLTKKTLRKNIIMKSLSNNGVIFLVNDLENCSDIINLIAPEHLHIQIKNYNKLLSKVNNAGGIFIGEYSAEAFGDYIVGTNHILPTSGAAKFSSGLGVLDFMKRNSVVKMNYKSFTKLKDDTKNMADIEGLDAHKISVKIRQKK